MKNLSSRIEVEDIVSITQYAKVISISNAGKSVSVITSDGDSLAYSGVVDNDYIRSADHHNEEKQVTKTELETIFKESARMPMTVVFYKQVKEKDVINAAFELYANKGGKILSEKDYQDQVRKVIKSAIKGEERLARGWHEGTYGVGGRINFTDMDKENDPSKDYDTRLILVDPRTIQSLIVNGVKYTLK